MTTVLHTDGTRRTVLTIDDLTALGRAAERAALSVARAAGGIGRAARGAVVTLAQAANEEVHLLGVETRFYVRAAQDPAYAAPAALDALVRSILDGEEDGLAYLTPDSLRRVATAAMAGWCEHRGTGDVEGTWHRLLSGSRVEVSYSERARP